MDPKELQRIINGDPQQPQQPPQAEPQAQHPGADAPQASDPSDTPTTPDQQASPPADIVIPGQQVQGVWDVLTQGFNAGSQVNPEIINHPNTPAEASAMKDAAVAAGMPAVTGGLKSVFETKDFLFGDTPPDQQSSFRQGIEAADAAMKEQRPIVAGLASGIGQFAVAMVGLGKAATVAKAVVPAARTSVAAVEGLKGGKVAMESGKAAMAGAMAFDPHEARLSNLIQDTPLANPFNAWLAAQPGDSAAMGRLKNAMESLGMDAAIIGTFTGALKVWKYLKAGKTAEASRAVGDMERARNEHINGQQAADTGQPISGDGSVQGAAAQTDAAPVPDGYVKADPGANLQGDVQQGVQPAPSDANNRVPPVQQPDAGAVQDTAGQKASPSGPEASPPADPHGAGSPQELGAASANSTEVPSTVTSTDTPMQAMESAGVLKPKPYRDKVSFTGPEAASLTDQIRYTLEGAENDHLTMWQHDGWSGAVAAGERLTPDLGNFYDRFNTDAEINQYIDMATQMKSEDLAAQGFRVKVGDKTLERQVNAYASLVGTDPAGVMGILHQAGQAAETMTAKMIVSGSLAAKSFQDAALLAMRRKLGDFTQFGSLEAMEAEIAKRFSIATTMLKTADEIRSQAGRSLRANRGKPFDPALFEGLGKDRLYDLLADSQGDPQKLKLLADPSLYTKIMDTVNYLRISSLVSGPKTQIINILSNGYMLGARPLERMLGAGIGATVGNIPSGTAGVIVKENLRQYAYMGSALYDSFKLATKAFTQNDGVLRPHGTELNATNWQVPGPQAFGTGYFKTWDSLPNVIYNALSVPFSVAGVPSRALGGMDELVKQIVYRSKLTARAHIEATQKAIEAGLDGQTASDFVKGYVNKALDNAFDAEGRGVDPEALREANIATFQQDLVPGSWGKGVQNLVNNDKSHLVRFILPFVKTPTNIIRYSWKMTPGLNLLQEEYRQMFSGKLGLEAKAQALGQMSLGSLFMGTAAFLASQGMITGGGPSDKNAKSQLRNTGWQEYSFVRKNPDGTKTYVPFNRYDPIGLPFGIIADIMDAAHISTMDYSGSIEDRPDVMEAIGALGISLAKQFTSRTYLLSLTQAMDAINDADRYGPALAGSLAQSMVPFSSATRQLSQDDYMRDARTITDKLMQVTPGLSEKLPPKYNWLGQPVLNRQGLWTDDNGSLVDMETQRLGLEGGGALIGVPSPMVTYGTVKLDLRNITMKTGENAYSAYQKLAGKPTAKSKSLRDQVAAIMRSKSYRQAPDGDRSTPGTKLWLLSGLVSKYRHAASRLIFSDPNVKAAFMTQRGQVVDTFKHLREPQANGNGNVDGVLNAFGQGGSQPAAPSGNRPLTPAELMQQFEPKK